MAPFPSDSLSSLFERTKTKGPCPSAKQGPLVWPLLELLVFLRVLLLEPFNAPFGVDNLLRPREKRMTV